MKVWVCAIGMLVSSVSLGQNNSCDTARAVEKSFRADYQILVNRYENTLSLAKSDVDQFLVKLNAQTKKSVTREQIFWTMLSIFDNSAQQLAEGKELEARANTGNDAVRKRFQNDYVNPFYAELTKSLKVPFSNLMGTDATARIRDNRMDGVERREVIYNVSLTETKGIWPFNSSTESELFANFVKIPETQSISICVGLATWVPAAQRAECRDYDISSGNLKKVRNYREDRPTFRRFVEETADKSTADCFAKD